MLLFKIPGMQEDCKVRSYQPGDEEEIVELLDLVFGGWPKLDVNFDSVSHWKWKYIDCPSGNAIVNVAESGNRIVGVDHSVPLEVKLGDKIELINYTSDLAVHPEFRRKGIAKMLINESDVKRKELAIERLFFATRRSYVIQDYSKMFPFPVLNLVRIRDINKQLRAIPVKNQSYLKTGFHILKFLNSISNVYRNRSSVIPDNLNLSIPERFDKKINTFFDKLSSQYAFILKRESRYLNWKYFDKRNGNYIVKTVEENKDIIGYIVYRINRYLKDYPIGYLIDLLALKNREDVIDHLLSDMINSIDENNVNIVNSLIVKGHPYEKIMKMQGFLDSRLKFNVITNFESVGKGGGLRNFKPSEIYFSYGDIDSLPVSVSVI
jgi:GNAT superfamily N-acetyltransferase